MKMNKITKWLASLTMGVVTLACLLGGILLPMGSTVDAAAATATTDKVEMVEGASVRVDDSAIRFSAWVNKAYYDGLGEDKEAGVYMIPLDMLNGDPDTLTHETLNAKKVKAHVFSSKTTADYYHFNAVLYDIPATDYGRAIVARAYVRTGNTYYWAENPQVRSLTYVASGALIDGVDASGKPFTDTQKGLLNAYVNDAIATFSFLQDTITVEQSNARAALSLPITIAPVYKEDTVSNLMVQYASDNAEVATVENGSLVIGKAGVATITATLGTYSDSIAVVVNGKNQDILMTDSTHSLDVSLPDGYTVAGITLADDEGSVSLGNDLANLVIPEDLATDNTKHGEKQAKVIVAKGDNMYVVTLPATVITAKITTLAEWQENIQPEKEGDVKQGYFILGNDIDLGANEFNISLTTSNYMSSTVDGSDGFRGTVDGRGFELSSNHTVNGGKNFGWFGEIGSGAVIKNLSITTVGLSIGYHPYVLGVVSVFATFENVVFNLDNINNTNASYGTICRDGFKGCTFTNVQFNITGTSIASLLGGGSQLYWGLNGGSATWDIYLCTFTNCYISGLAPTEVGHYSAGSSGGVSYEGKTYVAQGMDASNGETVLEGITYNATGAGATEVTLSGERQKLLLTDSDFAISLREYKDYDVQSITMTAGGTDYALGFNPSVLMFPAALKSATQYHGEQNLIVLATNGDETVKITVPVLLITAEIATAEEFKAHLHNATLRNTTINGYYVLCDDFDLGEVGDVNSTFAGTIDGSGYELTYAIVGYSTLDSSKYVSGETGKYGLFGAIAEGAVVKNLTLTNTGVTACGSTYMLAVSINGATFENVAFNLNKVHHRFSGYGVFAQSITNTHFEDVEIVSQATTHTWSDEVLFANTFSDNTFVNTTVKLEEGAGYSALAKNGSTVYTADGWTISGAETLSGITLVTDEEEGGDTEPTDPTTVQVTLSGRQELLVSDGTGAIDLGAYSTGYTINSIALNAGSGYSLGNNAAALTLSVLTDNQYHGEQNLTVLATGDNVELEITVPVLLITEEITTADEFMALRPANATTAVYGYYVLTNDIGSEETNILSNNLDGNYKEISAEIGFRGTIDGRGRTFSFTFGSTDIDETDKQSLDGLFGLMGTGATVKDLTLKCDTIRPCASTHLLGYNLQGAIFENVTISVNHLYSRYADAGLLSVQMSNCKFNNVNIVVHNATLKWAVQTSAFANTAHANKNGVGVFSGNEFVNTTLYATAQSKITFATLAKDGDTVISSIDGVSVVSLDDTHAGKEIKSVVMGGEPQALVLTDTEAQLDIGEYGDYTIQSISLFGDQEYSLGTNLNALDFSAVAAATQYHGEQNLTVLAASGNTLVRITVPVLLITKEITTVDELVGLMPTGATTAVYGYYVLASDIGDANTAVAASGRWFAAGVDQFDGENYGFKGTIDGNGHELTFMMSGATNADGSTGQCGLFGFVGKGAVIKNITLTNEGVRSSYNTYMLGKSIQGATFEDVVFNLNKVYQRYAGYGVFAEQIINTTFKNVEIVSQATESIGGVKEVLFANTFSDNTFENTTVKLEEGAGYSALAKNGTTVYTAEGWAIDGAEVLSGITVVSESSSVVTLNAPQDVVANADGQKINLGAYNGYTVQSITYNDVSLGTNRSSFRIDETDVANHGEGKQLVVVAKKDMHTVTITVPITLVTAKISTLEEWQNWIQPEGKDAVVTGYFVLSNDITAQTNNINRLYPRDPETGKNVANGPYNMGYSGEKGFQGTIDGRGYTLTNSATWMYYGWFGNIGKGATIKNISFTQPIGLGSSYGVYVFGVAAVYATFENVVINLNNMNNTNNANGVLSYKGFRGCTLTDVEINVQGTVASLFGGGTDSFYAGMNAGETTNSTYLCTFTNCNINLIDDSSSVGELGHYSDDPDDATKKGKTFVAENMSTMNGETAVEGIMLNVPNDAYLLYNGESQYTVVMPSTPTDDSIRAKDELLALFKEATGVQLAVIDDLSLTHASNTTFLWIGSAAKFTELTGNTVTLNGDGYALQIVDKNIYIVGEGYGLLNGAYDLMKQLFGFETYYHDVYTLDTDKTVIGLSAVQSLVGNPSVAKRVQTGIITKNENHYADRLGANSGHWRYILPIYDENTGTYSSSVHNSFIFFPTASVGTYTYNANYFAEADDSNASWWDQMFGTTENDGKQLCYTAHGTDYYTNMVNRAASLIEKSLEKYPVAEYPDYNNVVLGMEDNYFTCACDACQTVKETYGAESAAVILFLNDVATEVNAWMAGDGAAYARDLTYMFLAYNTFMQAPTTFPTLSDGVKIAPFVAMSEMDHGASSTSTASYTSNGNLTHTNADVLSWVTSWGAWAKGQGTEAWAWTYGNFFRDYFCFYDSYDFYADIFDTVNAENGYGLIYVQQQSKASVNDVQSAFMSLNAYVTSKLAWDHTLDMDDLISDYMNAMYLGAADEMMAVFTEWRRLFDETTLTDKWLSTTETDLQACLTTAQINNLLTLLDKAYTAIKAYSGDEALYAKLQRNVDMEWLAPAKILISMDSGSDIETKYNELIAKYNITIYDEGV